MSKFAFAIPDHKVFGIEDETLGDSVWLHLKNLCSDFGEEPVNVSPTRFSDTSFKIELDRSVRNKIVYLFVAPYMNASDQFMLTAQAIDACRAADSDAVYLMETYNPWYAQDKRDTGVKESVSGKIVARTYISQGLRRLFYFEPHSSEALHGWYDSFDPLYMAAFHANNLASEFELTDSVVGIPDDGSSKRAKYLSKALGVKLVKIGKTRDHDKPEEAEAMPINTNLHKKTVFLYDDMIRTGKTAIETSKAAKDAGAERVIYVATHLGIYQPDKLFGCPSIDFIRGAKTIPRHPTHEKLQEYDIADFAAQIIYRKTHDLDVSGYIMRLAPAHKA